MYRVTKRMAVAGAHALVLDYPSKCSKLHGHNWIIMVVCESEELNSNGMVVDFSKIKEIVSVLDHECISTAIQQADDLKFHFQATAENIAKWICEHVPYCVEVRVQESEGNEACYIK